MTEKKGRKKNAGGVYLRGKIWYIRITIDGKTLRKRVGPERQVAKAIYQKLKAEAEAAKTVEARELNNLPMEPRSFDQAVKDYVDERTMKKSSFETFKSAADKHMLKEFGGMYVSTIRDHHIRRFQVHLSKSLSPRTVNRIIGYVRAILEDAVRRGEIDRNPAGAVRREQEPRTKIDPLSQDELDIALAAIEDYYRPLFTTLAYTGARPNEILALRWGDIDWITESISISRGRVRGVEGLPKTRSSEREIPILPAVMEALRELRDRKVRGLNDHIFTNKKGEPIDKHLDRIWARALKKAGLRHRPSYQLRHTFATHLLAKNFPVGYVSRLLGHSTIDSVIRHYGRWIDSSTDEQNEKLRLSFGLTAQKEAQSKQSIPKLQSV